RKGLSVFDLLHGFGDLDQFWSQEPPPLTLLNGQRQEQRYETVRPELPQEVWDVVWRRPEVPQEVEAAFKASNECWPYCNPDFADQLQIRSIDGAWHLLQGNMLYRLEGNAFKLLGELPVTRQMTYGEGANGYTAQDYMKVDGVWYVTDTFGDRILRLDETFV